MKSFYRLLLGLVAATALGFFVVGCAPAKKTGLAWKLTGLDGREISSETFKGKVVIVDFWATWCAPCRVEIPGYIALQKKYAKDGLIIIGASVDQKGPADVKKFADENGINYFIAMADAEAIAAFGSFDAIPTTFLLDRAGRIVHQKTGAMDHAEYEAIVKQAL